MAEILRSDPRPTLLDLWIAHHFAPAELAATANVPESTIEAMLDSQPVACAEAEKVLFRLSVLLHQDLRLETVYVPLKTATVTAESQSELLRTMQDIDDQFMSGWRALYDFSSGTTLSSLIFQ